MRQRLSEAPQWTPDIDSSALRGENEVEGSRLRPRRSGIPLRDGLRWRCSRRDPQAVGRFDRSDRSIEESEVQVQQRFPQRRGPLSAFGDRGPISPRSENTSTITHSHENASAPISPALYTGSACAARRTPQATPHRRSPARVPNPPTTPATDSPATPHPTLAQTTTAIPTAPPACATPSTVTTCAATNNTPAATTGPRTIAMIPASSTTFSGEVAVFAVWSAINPQCRETPDSARTTA